MNRDVEHLPSVMQPPPLPTSNMFLSFPRKILNKVSSRSLLSCPSAWQPLVCCLFLAISILWMVHTRGIHTMGPCVLASLMEPPVFKVHPRGSLSNIPVHGCVIFHCVCESPTRCICSSPQEEAPLPRADPPLHPPSVQPLCGLLSLCGECESR